MCCKVTVIVPVYNSEKYLSKTITLIQNQTMRDIEIILYDDGSTDKSREICNEARKNDPRILVLHGENRGPGYARNTALKQARGTYVVFVDSDDEIEEDFLERLYEEAITQQVDFVMAGYLKKYHNQEKTVTPQNKVYHGEMPGEMSGEIHGGIHGSWEKMHISCFTI